MVSIEHELRGKRVLVTGAAGFIGSRLITALLDYDTEVIALVDEKSNLARIKRLLTNPRLHLKRCSLADIHTLSAQKQDWRDADLLAHLGLAPTGSNGFLDQSIEDTKMNLLPTMNLVKTLPESVQGICFASSVSVYGYPARLPVKENDLPTPISSYAVTKLAIENYLSAYGRTVQVPVTILRYATVYGPGEFGHRAIPSFLHAIAERQPPLIYGDGLELRDYVYIDDVVQATINALVLKPARVLNIGSGQGYSVSQIAQEVIRLCSVDTESKHLSVEKENMDLICDISAAEEALAYSPKTSLEKGLTEEIEWYKKQVQSLVPTVENKYVPVPKSKVWFRRLFTYSYWRYAADRLMALLGIIILLPLLALIAVGIKLDSHESPIFAQERVGKHGRKFVAYKFRTMCSNGDDRKYKAYLRKYILENAPYRVDNSGQRIYKVDDSHVTRFGRRLLVPDRIFSTPWECTRIGTLNASMPRRVLPAYGKYTVERAFHLRIWCASILPI
jgi:UDP-glucose 4-epimerase